MTSPANDILSRILTNPALVPFEFFAVRILMALMFIESFADKLFHWDHYLMEITGKGIPLPTISLIAASVIEILGSLSLISGRWLRYGTIMLAAYIFVLQFFYFDFWSHKGITALMERKEFLKNIAVIAGLFLLALIDSAKQVRISTSTLP